MIRCYRDLYKPYSCKRTSLSAEGKKLKTITIEVPISSYLSQEPLTLSDRTIKIDLDISPGDHHYVSEPIEVGTFHESPVFASISIPYTYDSERQYLTISGHDDFSDSQISIQTSLNLQGSLTYFHTINQTNKQKSSPNIWSEFVAKNLVVQEATQFNTRSTIATFIQAALGAGIQGVIQKGTPPAVTHDSYNEYKNMFSPDLPDTEKPTITEISDLQYIVQSTYFGTITWNLDYSFANIIGSTDDQKVGPHSWIGLWRIKCNDGHDTNTCSSYNYSDGENTFTCGTNIVGGHVIPGNTAGPVTTGGTAYIFPICKRHNNNNNIFMSMRYNPTGVVLHNYNKILLR